MSSVDPLTTPTTPAGDDYVSALALDAVIASIIDKINQLIVAMGQMRDETSALADGVVRWRMFSTRAKQVLSDFIEQLGSLYTQSGTARWSNLPVPDGGAYSTGADSGFFSGFTAVPPGKSWSITVPGVAGVPYRIRLLTRHFTAPAPTGTATVVVTGSSTQSWELNPAPMAAAIERVLEFTAYAGDVIAITFVAGTEFSGDPAMPQTREDRFPYRPRYRAAGAFQFDWMVFAPPGVGDQPDTDTYYRLRELVGDRRLLENGSFRLLESAP